MGLYVFNWPISVLSDWKYISIAHVIFIIKSEVSTFALFIIVQFMTSVNSRIRFGLQIVLVCLYRAPSHYHHCANLFESIELMKCLCDIFCRVCEWRLSIFSPNIYTLSYYHHHQIGSMNYYQFLGVRSWNNCVRCMSFNILKSTNSVQITTQNRIHVLLGTEIRKCVELKIQFLYQLRLWYSKWNAVMHLFLYILWMYIRQLSLLELCYYVCRP